MSSKINEENKDFLESVHEYRECPLRKASSFMVKKAQFQFLMKNDPQDLRKTDRARAGSIQSIESCSENDSESCSESGIESLSEEPAVETQAKNKVYSSRMKIDG